MCKMKRLNIVILTREYPPETTWGGCSIVNYNLARALAGSGHEVHVICQGVNHEYDKLEEGVWVHRVGKDARNYSVIAWIKYMLSSWRKLRELRATGRVDVIQADYCRGEGIIGTFQKKSVLIIKSQYLLKNLTSLLKIKNGQDLKNYLGLVVMRRLTNFVSKRADRIISESKIDCEGVIKDLNLNPEKVDLIYNGIDTDLFCYKTPNVRNELGLSKNNPLVLFAGRLVRQKGIDILGKAIPLVLDKKPDTRFLFIGEDEEFFSPFRSWMELQAEKNGFISNLIFKGFQQHAELPGFYSACDVFILPSRKESFALVVAEAMACGRPVVATPVGIVPELNQEKARGLKVVPKENIKELAKGILEMLSLTDQEKKYVAQENRELIRRNFCFSSWTDQITNTYEKALKKKENIYKMQHRKN